MCAHKTIDGYSLKDNSLTLFCVDVREFFAYSMDPFAQYGS